MKTQTVTLVEILPTDKKDIYLCRFQINPKHTNYLIIESQMNSTQIWYSFDIHPDDLQNYIIQLDSEYNHYCNS